MTLALALTQTLVLTLTLTRCAAKRVLPYFVPVGGFMLTPRYDDDPEEFRAALQAS